MLPLFEREIVEKKKWLNREEFLDNLALAQSMPGILAVNIAISTGYKLKGSLGSIIAVLGATIPSFFIILLIAIYFHDFRNNPLIYNFFLGVKPAVVALIGAVVFRMAKKGGINRRNFIIPLTIALIVPFLKISPILIIVLGIIWGIIGFYLFGKNGISSKLEKNNLRKCELSNAGGNDIGGKLEKNNRG